MNDRRKLPEGFTCKCGFVVKYPAYVYAHWRDVLIYTCEGCGKKYSIVCGTAKATK